MNEPWDTEGLQTGGFVRLTTLTGTGIEHLYFLHMPDESDVVG